MKESNMVNNTNTHAYTLEAVNEMFTHTHVKKLIKLFSEIAIAETIKQFKQLDEGAMRENPVVIP